jgi:WD40 repeat protein
VGYFLKVTEDAVSNVDQQRQTVVQARKNAQQRRINSLQQEIAALDAQIDALKEADSIQAFAIKRLADDEYHRQEGLLSLLRRDLEELSRRLAPSGVGSSMSGAPVPDMERIILYIDDLDRCPADRVVQVLQAIHLLLAFPLFVVIVGVDSRWLLRSLRAHYREVLGAADGRAEGDEKSVDEHWAATPQNYLEKIFQISLCLRPMSSTGYEGLVAADIGRVLEDGVNIPAASPEVESGSVVADSTTDDISVGLASEGSATRVPTALSRQERNTASVQATMIQQYIEQGRVLAVGFSPSFSTTQPVLISVTTTGHITCRDLRRTSAELLADHRVGSSVTTAHLTTDNRALVIEEPVPGRSMTFSRIIDSRTGEEASRIDVNCEDGIHADDVVMSHDGKAVAVSWATDDGRTLGQSVADLEAQTILDSADRIDGVPRLLAHSWRIEYRDGSCQWIANDPSRQPVFLGVHPASRFITDQRESRFAAISPEGLQVWSIDNEPTSIPLPEDASGYGSPLDIATLGPGTLLATAIDRNVKVWDLASARLRTEVTIDSTVTAIGFSADGRRLAVGTEDGTIQLWLIATPRPNEELASEPLRLTRAEATSIISVKSLIRTPRSALRLVNIYRLLRAGLRDDELEQLQSQDHGPVMLMLAIMIAFPRQSASLLGQLIGDDPLPGTFTGLIRSQLHKSSVPTIIRRDRLHSAEPAGLHVWRRLGSTVGRLITETMMQDEIGVYQRWAPYVARFSFRTEHLM